MTPICHVQVSLGMHTYVVKYKDKQADYHCKSQDNCYLRGREMVTTRKGHGALLPLYLMSGGCISICFVITC